MTFKAYFDGAELPGENGTEPALVTLAALSGGSPHWNNFDRQWRQALERHRARWLHTTDAVCLTRDFSRRHGWSEIKRDLFIDECVAVLERCCTAQDGKRPTYIGLRPTTITVNLPDFEKAVPKVPELRSAEHLCAVQCAAFVFLYGQKLGATRYFLFFDRGERYYGHFSDRWNNRKIRKVHGCWEQVKQLTEADWRTEPALQAADLFAWAVNDCSRNGRPRFGWQERVLKIPREKDYFPYRRILKASKAELELTRSWNLPPRRRRK